MTLNDGMDRRSNTSNKLRIKLIKVLNDKHLLSDNETRY